MQAQGHSGSQNHVQHWKNFSIWHDPLHKGTGQQRGLSPGFRGGGRILCLASSAECLAFADLQPLVARSTSSPTPQTADVVIIKNTPVHTFPKAPLEGGTSPAAVSSLGAPCTRAQVKSSLRVSGGLGDWGRIQSMLHLPSQRGTSCETAPACCH